jgi:protein-disulfide isomerase/uncharacterized membrane protein
MKGDSVARWALPLLVLLAFTGAGVGIVLTNFHMSQGKDPWKLFELACGKDASGCAEVLTSRWAVLPGGNPLAALGFVYFGGLGLWYLVVGRANRLGRFWQALTLSAQIAGGLASIFYLGVMLMSHAICWWCTLSHFINFALLFLAWKLWPRDTGTITAPRPPPRLAVAGILMVVGLAAVTLQRLALARQQALAEKSNRYAQSLRQDVDLQRYLYLRQPTRPIMLRSDEPVRGNRNARHIAVVFSDFQCPGCRQFASFSQHELLPRFGDRLKIVYRHFPLDPKCNPWQDQVIHHQACEAAFAAEVAREIGGANAFWRMHDLLFAQQSTLSKASWADLGRQAGLDGAALAQQVTRQTPRMRILQDAEAGHAVQLEYTPTVFLDGRPLDDWSRLDLWQALLVEPSATAPLPPSAPK